VFGGAVLLVIGGWVYGSMWPVTSTSVVNLPMKAAGSVYNLTSKAVVAYPGANGMGSYAPTMEKRKR
jgi:hypothetical protein